MDDGGFDLRTPTEKSPVHIVLAQAGAQSLGHGSRSLQEGSASAVS